MKRKRKDRGRMYNSLDSRAERTILDLGGFAFMLYPNLDPVAWKALEFYASITPNAAQRQALLVWLREHPDPAGLEAVQMEMEMTL